MTSHDPITAIADQLAAHAEQLTRLEARQDEHHAAVSGRLAELTDQAAALGRVVAEHAAALTQPRRNQPDRPRPRRLLPRAGTGVVEAGGRRPSGTGRPAAGLGRAGLPARLRAPGRRPRPLLARPRPVPVRAGHRSRAVVGAVPAARPHPGPGLRPGRIPGPHPARPGRPAPRRDQPLRPPPQPRAGRRPALEHPMTGTRLGQALAYAARGWPVFPCQAGQKIPATAHGHLRRHHRPRADHRLVRPATRTGTWPSPPAPPDPTSWTSTTTAPPGTGTPRSPGCPRPACWTARPAYVRTPSGGLHAYFTGSAQRNGHLPAHHLDFRSRGGYVLAPPSRVDGKPYQVIRTVNADGSTGLGRRHRPAGTPPPAPPAPAGPGPRPGSGLPGPLGRRPARRQPQRGPVLGRQPRPGRRPRRRPQPAGRRRPPGRPGRAGDHQNPRFRPQRRPDPQPRTRLPARSR